MVTTGGVRKSSLIGEFMKKKREALNLSQRALGMLFTPAVTTQFISNIERGVTPLPPAHVATIAKALQVPESELMALMEREYTQKLSDRLGKPEYAMLQGSSPTEGEQFKRLWEAYARAENPAQVAFLQACESILHVTLKKP